MPAEASFKGFFEDLEGHMRFAVTSDYNTAIASPVEGVERVE